MDPKATSGRKPDWDEIWLLAPFWRFTDEELAFIDRFPDRKGITVVCDYDDDAARSQLCPQEEPTH